MNKLDIAGILMTYSEKISKAQTSDKVKEFVIELKKDLDMRKLEKFDNKYKDNFNAKNT